MIRNWKTTLFGAIAALGTYFTQIPDPAWIQVVGQIMSAIGMLMMGAAAKDSDKTGV